MVLLPNILLRTACEVLNQHFLSSIYLRTLFNLVTRERKMKWGIESCSG